MEEEQKSYRQIFKATSIFGGVQALNIVISIVRSKFTAVLLNPEGIGIAGLLTSTTGIVATLTNCGLSTSAVKNIAASSETGDYEKITKVVTVLRRLVWATGLLGTVTVAFMSSWLSQLTFGNKDYTFAFVWISITLLLQQLSSGQMVILQGLRKLRYLAKANVAGSIIGLLVSVPLYYFWRLDGIVPVIVISSFTSMLLSWYYSRKVSIRSVSISKHEFAGEGKEMVKMGLILNLNGIILTAVSYLVRIYISNTGGLEQVGLYTSGFAIINTYVGMVFSAMATDYYPRLAAVAIDNVKSRSLINQQAEIAILILAPFLTIFLVFINWIVILLYSNKFIPVNEMIHWAAMGIFFKASSWSVAFILIAKGASKIFLLNEVIANAYSLGFNILGYRIAGLEGLGISFLVTYLVYSVQVTVLTRLKYSFSFTRRFFGVAGVQFLIGVLCFIVARSLISPWNFIMGSFLIGLSVLFSLRELEKRIGIKEIIVKRFIDFKNK